MSQTVTVSIGRNVGSTPLDASTWSAFRTDVHRWLDAYCDTFYVVDAFSQGEWIGIPEESRTWVASLDYDGHPEALVTGLGLLARQYGQDAIAVTTGTTVLAGLSADSNVA